MIGLRTFALAGALAGLAAALAPHTAAAQSGDTPSMTQKLNAYIGCVNRLTGRAYESRARYFSWAAKSGPTGKERIIYGTYTIYDTSDCVRNVEKANAMEPHDAELEAAATAYADAVSKLAPLLKEADDYYTQENYKDDKMAKGKALHPQLVAGWDAFSVADHKLRDGLEAVHDKRALEKLAEIEKSEGRQARYYVEALMIQAKRVERAAQKDNADVAEMTKAIDEYESSVKGAEQFTGPNAQIGSMFIGNAKSFLTTSKQLMRRIRDKTPYSSGERMMLNNQGSGWMVEGSPPRLMRDYNQLVDAYNRGARI